MKFPYNREPAAIASELQETASATAVDSPKTTGTSNSTLLSVGERVMLQTATSTVKNPKMTNSESARILMDCGSNRSYITSDLAKKLNLFCTAGDAISVNRFAAHKTVTVATKYAEIELLCRDGSKLRLSVNVVPTITGTIQRAQLNLPTFKRLCKDLPLADTLPLKPELTSVQLLIGNDYYSDIITGERMQLHPGLYLLGSQLGWVLSGRLQETPCRKDPNVALFVHSQSNFASQAIFKALPPKADDCLNIPPDIQDLWKLESIGITDCPETSDDEAAQAAFDRSVKFENDRYQVTWPWKREPDVLPENYQLALGRLKSLLTRAKQVPELIGKFKDVIADQLKKGVIEPVDKTVETGPYKHYIPHHAVITPQKTTTKIRIVYDASARTRKDNPSLNECLYRGPVYLENLCGLLLRFRTHPLILLSDIEKAFLQVGLQPKDRDVTRFLWLRNSDELHTDKNVQIYRFCRVPFGMIFSPFLLGATIVHHLKQYDDPVATEIRHNLYVDNVMIGATDTGAAVRTYKKAKQIFRDASMNLREWVSNSQEFQATLPDDDRVKSTKVKVLGLSWDTETDTMSVPESEFPSEILTKRHVLKTVAQVFDRLGLFLPITIMGKLYLQKLWVNELSWDCPIPSELINEWSPIYAALKEIPSLQLKRFLDIDKNREYTLLVFCDASQNCYAAAVYLWNEVTLKANLLFAKGRVKPTRNISLPRLELMSVLIGIRALQFVEKEMRLKINNRILFTDSQCVLHWLKSVKVLSVFVENRIREIKTVKNVEFRYVRSDKNPADLPTRGKSLDQLSQTWWDGPSWLKFPIDNWPKGNMPETNKSVEDRVHTEVKDHRQINVASVATDAPVSPFAINEVQFSSFVRLIRVTALCMKFVNKLNGQKIENCISAKDFDMAKDIWVRHVQNTAFQDETESIFAKRQNQLIKQLNLWVDKLGLIRCSGRLQHASDLSYDSKYPKLMPNKTHFTKLTFKWVHTQLCHAGVSQTLGQIRNEFWIPRGRTEVRSVIQRCLPCKRYESGPFKLPRMPDLPDPRVSIHPAFSFVEIDYMGPLYIRTPTEGPQKVWVCLFTCLTVRAIHVELVQNLNAEQFLLCLRRFIARRGKPKQIISDNALQFKVNKTPIEKAWSESLKNSNIVDHASSNGIEWKFIVELAPWAGGFYERLIGVVKRSLRKCLGKLCLSHDQLATLLIEIEAVVNSRPLTYVGEGDFAENLITPAHFLTMNRNTSNPNMSEFDAADPDFNVRISTANKLIEFWKKGLAHLNQFWTIWCRDYLLSMREQIAHTHKQPRILVKAEPKIGQVVLIKEPLQPRGKWKAGRIEEFISGTPGAIRGVKVRLPDGKFINRPVNLLFLLECDYKAQIPDPVNVNQGITPVDSPVNIIHQLHTDIGSSSDRSRPIRKAAQVAKAKISQMASCSSDDD